MASICITLQAAPTITLTHDFVRVDTFVIATGEDVIPPHAFTATYEGPLYSGPGSLIDRSIDAFVLFNPDGGEGTDYATFNTATYIGHYPLAPAPFMTNSVFGQAIASPTGGGHMSWYGKAEVQLDWRFYVTGEDFTLQLMSESDGAGRAGYSLFDLTANASIGAHDSLITDPYDQFDALLLAGHEYQLIAYARAETIAGDPGAKFEIGFGNATLVAAPTPAPVPESGSSHFFLGIATFLGFLFRAARR